MNSWLGCSNWKPAHHVMYHVANGCLCLGLVVPDFKHGALLLHGIMALGYLLLCTWSWIILCGPDFFSWNFALLVLNGIQAVPLLYNIRDVAFTEEHEDVYASVFKPLRVSRRLFKKLVSPEFCSLMTLHDGEAYAIQSVTRTDKLALLVTGTMQAYSGRSKLLHSITDKQFIDSPEFESTITGDEKFQSFPLAIKQVSIVASGTCKYLAWPRQGLEYLLVKEPHLACLMKTMIGRDITDKLYALNNTIAAQAGSRLDIRLPSIPCSFRYRHELKRASVGARESGLPVSGSLDEITDSDLDSPLGRTPDANETDEFVSSDSRSLESSKTSHFMM